MLRAKTTKVRRKCRVKLYGIGFSSAFLDVIPEEQATRRRKIDKLTT